MKISNNFDLEEFVYPELFERFGAKSRWYISPELIKIAEYIRKVYGKPVNINTWSFGGDFKYRGLRPFNTDIGAEFSLHKFGKAFDFHIEGIESEKIQLDLIQKYNSQLFDLGVRAIELGTKGWTHIDLRNTDLDFIHIIKV